MIPPARIAGIINLKNLFKPGFFKLNFGTGSLLILLRGNI